MCVYVRVIWSLEPFVHGSAIEKITPLLPIAAAAAAVVVILPLLLLLCANVEAQPVKKQTIKSD